jgi:UDP-glucose:(heptosyl)LPS alpha-1,3-glucosyltransferase
MKIALVILHADPARGGAERYTVDLAAALAQRGHDLHVLAQSFAELPAGVRAIEMPSAPTRTMSYRRFLRGVDAQIDKTRYDIIHTMLPVQHCDVYHPHAGLAAAAMRKANRFFNPRRLAMAGVERKLLKSPDAPVVICLSEYVKRAVIEYQRDLPPAKLATLFNAVDLKKFDPESRPGARRETRERFGINDEHVVALIIAQDFERKGLRELIDAVPRVADSRLRVVVVGKENSSKFATHARELNIADRVIFAGPTADPFAFYAAADLFVLPTRHDPCSLVVLEAMAMGLPVISTLFNGATEIMTDGVHGYVLGDPHDIDALAGAMRKVLDPELRRRMSQACLELRPQLSYDAHVDRLLDVYDQARK